MGKGKPNLTNEEIDWRYWRKKLLRKRNFIPNWQKIFRRKKLLRKRNFIPHQHEGPFKCGSNWSNETNNEFKKQKQKKTEMKKTESERKLKLITLARRWIAGSSCCLLILKLHMNWGWSRYSMNGEDYEESGWKFSIYTELCWQVGRLELCRT